MISNSGTSTLGLYDFKQRIDTFGNAAYKNTGTQAGNVMEVGAFGLGGLSPFVTQPDYVNKSGFYHTLNTNDMAYCAFLNIVHSGQDAYMWQLGAPMGDATLSKLKARIRTESGWSSEAKIWNQHNTTVDSNGFIKAASPIVQLFADKIELNAEAQQQSIQFEKLGVGDYLLKNSSGLSNDGWYIEQPKDVNGNVYHAVVHEQLKNGDISVKTFEQKLDGTRVVADLENPVDIKEGRFISIRLNELPQYTTAPTNPTIVDDEGNPAPSKYHTLENGVWVISGEDAKRLEQKMQPLTRRQFRLTLAMNGYDLSQVEVLIDQIPDPMQRQITLIEWQDATTFERNSSSLLVMAGLMQLNKEQVDALWSQASLL